MPLHYLKGNEANCCESKKNNEMNLPIRPNTFTVVIASSGYRVWPLNYTILKNLDMMEFVRKVVKLPSVLNQWCESIYVYVYECRL